MTRIVEIAVEPLTHEAFAPFGEIIGAAPRPPDWARPRLDAWKMRFSLDGTTELRVMRYHHQPARFSVVERHVTLTEGRVPMGGAQAIMVVGPPAPASDPDAVPAPEAFRAFLLDGSVGIMMWRGTWHPLDCYPLKPPHADFGFFSEVEAENEIEHSADPRQGVRTQITDYLETHGLGFRVTDPAGHIEGGVPGA